MNAIHLLQDIKKAQRNNLSLLFVFVLLVGLFISCSKQDKKPKTVPVVTTITITDVTSSSGLAKGEITDDGNASIIASGFVYSSIIAEPTLAENKLELTTTAGVFTGALSNLKSDKLYHVRAYATNSIGTGYGEILDFTTANQAPVAANVSITGEVKVDEIITVTYSYTDAENNVESGTAIQWYVADDAGGAGEHSIDGATSLSYTLQTAQNDKYIRVGVTPKAAGGTITGVEVKSAFAKVGEPATVTFDYNSVSVTYGILISAKTGRRWLDRNLGAQQVPASVNDYANYGDLFQWGRKADGHQLIVRTGPTDADVRDVNGTTSNLSNSDDPGSDKFILVDFNSTEDWRSPKNDNLWQGVNGINNPCPSGWRIPTKAEWIAEGITSLVDGYAKLKITLTGRRDANTGQFFQTDFSGSYHTSNIGGNPIYSVFISIGSTGAAGYDTQRAGGRACRCIKGQ